MTVPRASVFLRVTLALVIGLGFLAQHAPFNASAATGLHYLFASGSATGGKRVSLRIKLTEPAPAGGVEISLSSSDPAVPVPATTRISEGLTEKTVGITTVPVTSTRDVTVTASYAGVSRSNVIRIYEPRLSSLSVQSKIRAAGKGKIIVRLSGRAPAGGITVSLNSNRPSILPVPSSATIQPGAASAIVIVDAADITSDVYVRITTSYDGRSFSKVTIVRYYPSTPQQTFTVTRTDGNAPIEVGGRATFDVCISEAPSPSVKVVLKANNPTRAISSPDTLTFTPDGPLCRTGYLTDRLGPKSNPGNAALEVWSKYPGGVRLAHSENVLFPPDPATLTPTADSTTTPIGEADETMEPTETPIIESSPTPEPTLESTEPLPAVTPEVVVEETATEVVPTDEPEAEISPDSEATVESTPETVED